MIQYKCILEYHNFKLKNYHKWVNHSTTDNMLAVCVSFHVYALKY